MSHDSQLDKQPESIYVWLVPSEEVLEQPGSWRIRKWDTAPFPEATHTARSSLARIDLTRYINAASISGGDAPHEVVEKLQRAIDGSSPEIPDSSFDTPSVAARGEPMPELPCTRPDQHGEVVPAAAFWQWRDYALRLHDKLYGSDLAPAASARPDYDRGFDDGLLRAANMSECANPNDGRDHTECPFCENAKAIREQVTPSAEARSASALKKEERRSEAGLLVIEPKSAPIAPTKLRGTYVPHTEHEIELIRSCLDDGTYTKLEQKDIGKLCDMAINCLLYGEEIQRLRSAPIASASGRKEIIEACAKIADRMQEAAGAVLAAHHNDDAAVQHDTAMEIAKSIRAIDIRKDSDG